MLQKVVEAKQKPLKSYDSSGKCWSCWADSNRRPHPYQVIKCSPAVAAQGFAGVFAAKRMRSETLCSMCSVRAFPRVGHGVGRQRNQQRCGSTFDGRGMVTHFALLKTIKRYQSEGIEPPGGAQCSRQVALQVFGMGQNVGQSVFSASRNGGRTS